MTTHTIKILYKFFAKTFVLFCHISYTEKEYILLIIFYYKNINDTIENIDIEIPFNLPNKWIWCRGYSCFTGIENIKPQGEFFDYIDIDSVDNHLHCIKQAKHIPVAEAPSRASRLVKLGSVLFSLVRPYLKNIALVEEKHSHSIASTGFYVCNSNGVLLPKFMFYLMISNYVVCGLNQYMKGDNSPSISKDNIENWLYPIPPIEEQKLIYSRLDYAFSIIEKLEKSLIWDSFPTVAPVFANTITVFCTILL